MRYAARTDANQAELVRVFRDLGVKIVDTSMMGKGYSDLNAVYRGQIHYVEVKDGAKPPCERRLTADQVRFHHECSLHGVKVRVVEKVDDVTALVQEWRK